METNYEKSNRLTLPDITFSELVRNRYNYFRNLTIINQSQLQELSNYILNQFGLLSIPIRFQGIQPHKNKRGKKTLRQKTMGIYSNRGIHSAIQVYKYTAKRKQQLSPKSAISTLLHEVMHHIDSVWFNINSIHCRGFYLRLQQLQEMLI